MEAAAQTAKSSTCCSVPKGAIIVKDNNIIASGYNNVPNGVIPCSIKYGGCYRRKLGYASGEGLQYCKGIHAEAMAIHAAEKNGLETSKATLYTTHFPCDECAKLIINSGISRVLYSHEYKATFTKELFSKANVHVERLT